MESFRNKIRSLRCRNHHNTPFIPRDSLNAVTKETVRQALEESAIEKHHYQAVEQFVHGGNARVFAILLCIGHVEQVTDFIRSDQFQSSHSLNHQLPFTKEFLSGILPEEVASKFYEDQWEYAAPVFTYSVFPRDLHDSTVLPILHEREIDGGSFGRIFEVTLHEAHHSYRSIQDGTNIFIRKDFRLKSSESPSDFELELRNLTILGHLKHPCVIELLSAYTWKGTYSLIFPRLEGNLQTFLSNPTRPEKLQSDALIIVALAQLSHALQHVHNFVARSVELELTGCHHDLKPDNVFLDGTSFVLADFGLSTFKPVSQGSKTKHRIGNTIYQAPECEDITNEEFTKGNVGRKKDIWAFGCIIAEVHTYLCYGPKGIKEFESRRTFKPMENLTMASFHCGKGPNPAVEEWLSRLEQESQKPRARLARLIKRMLQINPNDRPDAETVTAELQQIALLETTYPTDDLFDAIGSWPLHEEEQVAFFVEQQRYQSWKETCRIIDTLKDHEIFPKLDFRVYLDLLSQLEGTLKEVRHRLPSTDHTRLLIPVKHLNSQMQRLLPDEWREKFQTLLIQKTVIAPQSLDRLEKSQKALESDPDNLAASRLAKLRLMTKIAEECWGEPTAGPRLDVDRKCVELEHALEHHHLGTISTSRAVFIEWLCYETQVVSKREGEERAQRIKAIARLLNSANEHRFRVLRFSSFFHDPAKSRFGLAFDIPSVEPTEGEDLPHGSVVTLSQLFESSRTERGLARPPLGERFKLALALASSVGGFHKVHWLHRNISPHNIIFCRSNGNLVGYSIEEPYIVGFSHSRPNDPKEFTQGPGQERQDYQHPEYIKTPQRYRLDFDYYSLAVVLLEIAHWKSLDKMTADNNWQTLTPKDFRLALIKNAKSSRLAYTMGTRYCQVIETCLSGRVGSLDQGVSFEQSNDVNVQLQNNFQSLVVDELSKCSA